VALGLALALVGGACSGDDDGETSAGGDDGATATTAPAGDGPDGEVEGEGGAGVELPPLPERFAGHTSEVYAETENWVCHPDRTDDVCDGDLDTTVVRADGTTEVVEVEVAEDPPVDCFYVYPTVNPGPGAQDTAMAADTTAEDGVAELQLAHMGQVCRVYAPIYRQLTFEGFGSPDAARIADEAYADVLDAFSHYLANHNDGRPVVLYGHSQGSGVLARLMAEEFDGDEAMTARLVSALLIGGRVTTAEGSDVGGSFEQIPVCDAPDAVGCVVGLSTVGPDASESILSQWGGAPEGERKVCANPAGLDGEPAPLRSIVASQDAAGGAEGPLVADTPFVALEGALVAECVDVGAARVLEAEVNTADGWAPEGLETLTTNIDFWGLHIVEVNLILGDLVDLVRTQSEAFTA
jgi:pimeloyl-ACP methyl ester carboxylesterase